MKTGICFILVLWCSSIACAEYGVLRPLDLPETDFIYAQYALSPEDDTYPRWNPAESACALHPAKATALAIETVQQAIPEVRSWRSQGIALECHPRSSNTLWYYRVTLFPVYENKRRSKPVTITVGINGSVPALEKMTRDEWRACIREQLEAYQLEVLQSGSPPLPIPLTPELKQKLEDDGIPLPERHRD